jgi:ABC-type transport system substrate-binding protein
MQIFSDPSAAVNALESHAVDMVYDVQPSSVGKLKHDGFQIQTAPPGGLDLELRLNPKVAPFSNTLFRRTMNFAVDRAGISRVIRAGYGQPAVTAWYPKDPTYEKHLLNVYKYNPNKVATGTKESGVSDTSFKIMLSTAYPDTIAVAQVIQADLKSMGITTQLEQLDPATYTTRLLAGDYQATVSIGGGASRYPASIAYNSTWRVVNNALWGASLPAMYTKAIAADDQALTKAAQAKALRQLQAADLLMSSVVVISDRPTIIATSSKVHGMAFTLDAMPLYGSAWMG